MSIVCLGSAAVWMDLPCPLDTCERSRCARQTALAAASTGRRCTRQEVADRRLAMTAPAHEWSGMYRGDIAGTPATLQLTEAGGGLHGVIDAGGYRYLLQVRAAGTTASGTFQDPQAGGTGEASLALAGDVIEVAVVFAAAAPAREIRLTFTRDGASVVTEPAPRSEEHPSEPRLVDTWTRN